MNIYTYFCPECKRIISIAKEVSGTQKCSFCSNRFNYKDNELIVSTNATFKRGRISKDPFKHIVHLIKKEGSKGISKKSISTKTTYIKKDERDSVLNTLLQTHNIIEERVPSKKNPNITELRYIFIN
ncbi:MAG: hypothetical protein ACTSUV_02120 [Candidatus Ranarchaeia archaeon]